MTKLTKKQYLTQKARLEEELAATQSALDTMERQYAGGGWTHVERDEYNDLDDYQDTLKAKLATLDDQWLTRHWKAADFQSHRLSILNID